MTTAHPAHSRADGCPVALACTACPLARCLLDVRGPLPGAPVIARNVAILRAHDAGTTVATLAREYHVSWRHIFRIVARTRPLLPEADQWRRAACGTARYSALNTGGTNGRALRPRERGM